MDLTPLTSMSPLTSMYHVGQCVVVGVVSVTKEVTNRFRVVLSMDPSVAIMPWEGGFLRRGSSVLHFTTLLPT